MTHLYSLKGLLSSTYFDFSQLASEMLRLFDPTLEPQLEPPEEPLNLIPIYRCPNVTVASLPGELNYLHICKPSLPSPLDVQMSQPDYVSFPVSTLSLYDKEIHTITGLIYSWL